MFEYVLFDLYPYSLVKSCIFVNITVTIYLRSFLIHNCRVTDKELLKVLKVNLTLLLTFHQRIPFVNYVQGWDFTQKSKHYLEHITVQHQHMHERFLSCSNCIIQSYCCNVAFHHLLITY